MKKHLTLILFLSTLVFTAVSCNADDDQKEDEKGLQRFVGNWSGTFTGEDNGTWNFKVQETGKMTGVFKYTSDNVELDVQGRVSENGTVIATTHYGSMDIGVFNGTMHNTSVSGIWTDTDSDTEGTWEGTKN